MADNTDLLNRIIDIVEDVRTTQQEQGKVQLEQGKQLGEQGKDIKSLKQDVSTLQKNASTLQQDVSTIKDVQQVQGEKLDRVEDGQNRQHTTMKVLQGTIEETKAEVDKLLRRPRQAD